MGAQRMITVTVQTTASPLIMFASVLLKAHVLVGSKRGLRAKGQRVVLQTCSALATMAELSLLCQPTVHRSSHEQVGTSKCTVYDVFHLVAKDFNALSVPVLLKQ